LVFGAQGSWAMTHMIATKRVFELKPQHWFDITGEKLRPWLVPF
jgi:hypothetical protein